MQTVGNYLRQEREAKNISLGEVAHLTKISEFYLDFLEKDDYEKLPQGPYIKGYISSYARLIGINADEAIKLYNSLQEQMNEIEAAVGLSNIKIFFVISFTPCFFGFDNHNLPGLC